MKCLMRMHAQNNMGVIFFETCISFKQQRHTYIEAVPMPFEQFQDAPAYFRVSLTFLPNLNVVLPFLACVAFLFHRRITPLHICSEVFS